MLICITFTEFLSLNAFHFCIPSSNSPFEVEECFRGLWKIRMDICSRWHSVHFLTSRLSLWLRARRLYMPEMCFVYAYPIHITMACATSQRNNADNVVWITRRRLLYTESLSCMVQRYLNEPAIYPTWL